LKGRRLKDPAYLILDADLLQRGTSFEFLESVFRYVANA